MKEITITDIGHVDKYEEEFISSEVLFKYNDTIYSIKADDKVEVLNKYINSVEEVFNTLTILGVLRIKINNITVSYKVFFKEIFPYFINSEQSKSIDIHTLLNMAHKGEVIVRSY